MIVIFSTAQDYSTQLVIDWLHYFNHCPIIINELNPITGLHINLKSGTQGFVEFTLKSGTIINSNDIKVAWYRRGLYFIDFDYKAVLSKEYLKGFYTHMADELATLQTFILNFLKAKTIGDYEISDNNKLMTLNLAALHGLLIPDTQIVTNTNQINTKKDLISKTIKEVVNVQVKNHLYYTRTVKYKTPGKSNLFPSLLQREVIKKYELRIFYFAGLFYTMAIFSQQNGKTKVDFRDITNHSQLKSVPYILPESQRIKLEALIKRLGHTTCSIDMLVDEDDNYFFLELNPVGQFGMVSIRCNYFIERDIAKKLISYVG